MKDSVPELGIPATVVIDEYTHLPRTLDRRHLRKVLVRDAEELYGSEQNFDPTHELLVEELNIVSAYSLHVALYALQQGGEDARRRALALIGTSGDTEEHVDPETLLPLPVPPPFGWDHTL